MKRGEIWWASLPEPKGSEPGYRRPVLIVQSDGFNQSAIQTVIGAAITSNLRLSAAPGNVMLPKRESGLTKDSVINVSQLVTLNKAFLVGRLATISPVRIREVEDGLRLVLSL
ncbi:MAG: type II toxin-antitoxin system PemK/MazF family toxin [Candidatus Binataceae bacterium]